MNPAPTTSDHIRSLDALRGVAIATVMMHHFVIFTPMRGVVGDLYTSITEFFAHGVGLFFALSGFLLINSLSKEGFSGAWLKGFWLRRVAKILPLYLGLLLSVYLLIPAVLAALGLQSEGSVLLGETDQWPWHLLFCSNWFFFREGEFAQPLLNVSWSLGAEVQFYALLSLAFFTGLARSARFWLGIAIFAVATRLVALALDWNWVQVITFTPGRLDAFALGALVALRPKWFRRELCFLGLAVMAAPLVVDWDRQDPWINLVGYTWVALASAAAISLCLRERESAESGASTIPTIFTFLGRISYAVYLIHMPVQIAVSHLGLGGDRLLDGASAWGALVLHLVLAFGVSILLGWAVWRWCERPAQKWILGRFTAKSPRLCPAPSALAKG